MKPGIIIVGMGETGALLARRLCDNWDVVVIDIDPEALKGAEPAHVLRVHGDGTSALVLGRAGAERIRSLVAASDSDAVNLEILRVARERFGITNLFGVVNRGAFETQYRAVGAQAVNRHLACSLWLESRIENRKVPTGIGLGQGEIMEVEVLPNSSVIGQRLAELHPRRWLVGAVYRQGSLIVPHGDTVIEEGDRVVVIGEPEILPAIATHIGTGLCEFPLHYGTSVLVSQPRVLAGLLPEIGYLIAQTAAERLQVAVPQGDDAELSAHLAKLSEEAGVSLEIVSNDQASGEADASLRGVEQRDVGLIVIGPAPLPWLARIGLRRTRTARLLDSAPAPLLVARGTHPYRRLLLPLFEVPYYHEAARLAVDLVRVLSGELHLAVIHQPEIVVGHELRGQLEQKRREMERIANMYHVNITVVTVEGNPEQELVRLSSEYDAMVIPYRRRYRPSLTRPDVAQNVLHLARCSVFAVPC